MGRPNQYQVTSAQSSTRGRGGRGRGRGQLSSSVTTSSRVRVSGTGGGRGTRARTTASRGRGRGRAAASSSSNANQQQSLNVTSTSFDDDDDADLLCLQALSNFELTTNDFSKAFEDLNKSDQLPGFDKVAGDIWIYPTNRPVRDYQFNIVSTALYHNTMVSLPTGLGKTFIAAVVLYNFHRWYPNNLLVFMAPTRPLVRQQLDACHDLMGIEPSKMVELTGHISPKRREELWKEKRVFFLTPQVMVSDLDRGTCLAEDVRCIVVDEAHKALGNYAYSQVIRMVLEKNKCFRVLALSATPGNDLTAVQEVMANLLISKVELRSETSLDIQPYTHKKQIETIVVHLDQNINSVHDQVMEIFQHFTGKLMKQNALAGGGASTFTRFQLLKARDAYHQRQKSGMPNYLKGLIELDFAICISLAYAIDLLQIHGLRSFYSHLHSVLNKEKGSAAVAVQLRKTNLENVLDEVRQKLNISNASSFFDLDSSGLMTSFSQPSSDETDADPTNPEDYLLSHPKMRILKDLVQSHFNSHQSGTRIMIFSEYRNSVQEIGNMLNSLRPVVKPMIFLGQGKGAGVGGRGLRQKEQVQVVQSFKNGDLNVLISTCVGEEGLDIGEVDLIICYDASSSPTRLVQRMGRTGRQREGKTIFLLTSGREWRLYHNSVQQQQTISKGITDTSMLEQFLYKASPRMVPPGVNPRCFKMSILSSTDQKREADDENDSEVDSVDPEDNSDEENERQSSAIGKRKKPPRTKTASTGSKNSTTSTAKAKNKKTKSDSALTKKKDKRNVKVQKKRATKSDSIGTESQQAASTTNLSMDQHLSTNGGEEVGMDACTFDDENPLDTSFNLMLESEAVNDNVRHGPDQDYQANLKRVFGIKDLEAGNQTKCVFVPKLALPCEEIPELPPLEELDNIFSDVSVERLREKLNSIYVFGPNSDRCDCGKLVVDSDEEENSFVEKPNEPNMDIELYNDFDKPKPQLAVDETVPVPVPLQAYIEPVQSPQLSQKEKEELDAFNLAFEAAFDEENEELDFFPAPPTELETEERSPIFKRRSLPSSTPTLCNFDDLETNASVVSKSQNFMSPKTQNQRSSPNYSPCSSPEIYPASPLSPKKVRRAVPGKLIRKPANTFPVASSSTEMPTRVPPTRKELFPLVPASTKPVSTSPPSSDATYYESGQSQDDDEMELSPIITKTVTPASHPPTKKFIFKDKTLPERETPAEPSTNNLTELSKTHDTEMVGTNSPGSHSGSQINYFSPDLFDSTNVSANGSSRRVFSFRKPTEVRSTPAVQFEELLRGPILLSQNDATPTSQPESSNMPQQSLSNSTLRFSPGMVEMSEPSAKCKLTLPSSTRTNKCKTPTRNVATNQPQRWFNTSLNVQTSKPSHTIGRSTVANEADEDGFNSSDSDDVFFIPRNSVTQSTAAVASMARTPPSVECITPEMKSSTPLRKPSRRRNGQRGRRRIGSDFVLNEAEVEGDTGSDDSEEMGDTDAYDTSFVAVEESPPLVTETQQVRYIQSTKVTPTRLPHKKRSLHEVALDRIERTEDADQLLDEYQMDDEDSSVFCVPNDYIEYETTGDFTQRMDEARLAIQLESPSTGFKKNLRSKTRQQAKKSPEEFKAPLPVNPGPKKRKRVVIYSSDSE